MQFTEAKSGGNGHPIPPGASAKPEREAVHAAKRIRETLFNNRAVSRQGVLVPRPGFVSSGRLSYGCGRWFCWGQRS